MWLSHFFLVVSPGGLLLNPLGLIGLTAVPLIILLYILKLRRHPQLISSTLLWSKVLREMQANTPFQKLRNNLLMWLQILIVILLALALARPIYRGTLKIGKKVVVILDTSASMKTKDIEKETRFEKAKEGVQMMIQNMADGDSMMLLEGTRSNGVQTIFTSQKRQLYQSLDKMYPRDTPTELSESLLLAVSSLKGHQEGEKEVDPSKESGEIYVFSDGANLHLDRLNNIQIPVHLTQIGSSGDNLGIIALDVRRITGTKDEYEIFTNVKNFYAEKKTFFLSLKVGSEETPIDARELTLEPQENLSVIFKTQLTSGPMVLEIDEEDPFPVDNRAYYFVVEEKESPVLIVSDGKNAFLEKVLKLDPLAEVTVVRPGDYSEELLKDHELVIFDRYLPSSIPKINAVFIAPPPTESPIPEFPFHVLGYIAGSEITEWDATHPLMRYVEMSDVEVFQSEEIKYPVGFKPLVKTGFGPLMALVPYKNFEHLLIAFDIRSSNWVLRASFIIFFSNVLQQARISLRQLIKDTLAGQPVPIRVLDPQAKIVVTTPKQKSLEILNSGEITYFSQTDEVGFYTVRVGEQMSQFSVNLLNNEESEIAPAKEITLGNSKVEVQRTVNKANQEIWWWFAIVALIVTFLEWLVFHKRLV
ncbi:MAG: VWA domain-containing protein [Planctomycetota bacterium]